MIGCKKATKKLESELTNSPLTLKGDLMTRRSSDKYLGDQIAGSLSESVELTVKKRMGIANHAIYEIRTIVEDSRCDVVGAALLALVYCYGRSLSCPC